MKRVLVFLSLVVLAGCGADGEPVRPTADAGISIGTNGIATSASVGLRKGPVSLRIGL